MSEKARRATDRDLAVCRAWLDEAGDAHRGGIGLEREHLQAADLKMRLLVLRRSSENLLGPAPPGP